MRLIIVLIIAAFLVALYFYPLSTLTDEAKVIGNHLLEQAKK